MSLPTRVRSRALRSKVRWIRRKNTTMTLCAGLFHSAPLHVKPMAFGIKVNLWANFFSPLQHSRVKGPTPTCARQQDRHGIIDGFPSGLVHSATQWRVKSSPLNLLARWHPTWSRCPFWHLPSTQTHFREHKLSSSHHSPFESHTTI